MQARYEVNESIRASIEHLDSMRIDSDNSAREALADVMLSVQELNDLLNRPDVQDLRAAGILDRLKEWIHKLSEKLDEITGAIKGSTYSISVGAPPSVSVTVNFPTRESHVRRDGARPTRPMPR